jgi:hypothetical protein
VWSLPEGEVSVTADQFKSAALGFLHEVLGATRKRVETIQRDGWTRTDCLLDIPRLVSEQHRREAAVAELERTLTGLP